MKKIAMLAALGAVALLSLWQSASAQSDKPYADGPVWLISYVKTKDGMQDAYLRDLATHWVKMMKAAKAKGDIIDYKVVGVTPSSPDDWDMMIFIKVRNFAAMDSIPDQLEALAKSLLGNDDTLHQKAVARNDLRIRWGGRIGREVDFK